MPPDRPPEVACKVLVPFLEALRRQGRDPAQFAERAGVPFEHLNDATRWIDWHSFSAFLDAVGETVSEEDFGAAGRESISHPLMRPVGIGFRVLFSLESAYRWGLGPKGLLQRHYTCLTCHIRKPSDGQLEVDIQLKDASYPLPRLFFVAVMAQNRSLPELLGLPPTDVTMQPIERGYRYRLLLPAMGRRRSLKRVLALPKAMEAAALEVSRTHGKLLQQLRRLEAEVQIRRSTEEQLRREMDRRKDAEEERAAAEEELRHAQRLESIGTLAGGVAHDFNNVLVAIMGNADLAAKHDGCPDEVLTYLHEITQGAERAAQLTRQLLTFGRRRPLAPIDVDVNQVMLELQNMLQRLIPERIGIQVRPKAVRPIVWADRGQLEQVIVNLCINARDAIAERGTITISTSLTRVDEALLKDLPGLKAGEYLELVVSDDGTGISPDVMKRIYDPFFTTKQRDHGSGLGLSVVFGIVKQHGGAILASSREGQGTAMRIFLPRGRSSSSLPAPRTTRTSKGGSETVLVVEDQPQVRRLAQKVLEGAGYRVISAEDGNEGMKMLREHGRDIHLLLLDVVLPGTPASAIHREARKQWAARPVIFASGYSPQALYSEFMLEQGADLLRKPYSPDELLQRVREALDARPNQQAEAQGEPLGRRTPS